MQHRKRFLVLIATLFFSFFLPCLQATAQFDNNWYFGRRAGLNFSVSGGQNTPTVLTDGILQSNEAAATISDEDGNLLFYTNGVEVYNKNHQRMPNGFGLGGNISACQMSIVPFPGDRNLFYIFTADAFEDDFINGYRYSVVDITLDGGRGDVISKNNLLWANCTERMAAVRHANGLYVWLITNDFESNVFRAWLIDCNGLQANPVVSTVGDVLNMGPLANVGVLKASPDGKYLCQTHFPNPGLNQSNFIQLFDFDNATGVLSNVKKISPPATKYNHCEFSPDSKLLYVTRKEDNQLDQLEITLPTVAEILASRISFPTVNSYFDIQLAVDEKIYTTRSNALLAVINKPNLKGAACDFKLNAINLVPNSAFIGLPSHINDIVGNRTNGFDFTILDNCTGEVQFNGNSSLPPPVSWLWDFGDGNISTQQNPVHIFANPSAIYKVKLTISTPAACGNISRTRQILPAGFIKPTPGFSFVNVCDSGYYRFINLSSDLQDPAYSYVWDFGDGNTSTAIHPVHSYNSSGNYSVKLKILTGASCFDDSVTLPVNADIFTIQTIPDQTISFGESVTLTTTGPTASYVWTPPTALSSTTVKSPVARPKESILYIVTATDANNCKSADSVLITVIPPEDVNDIYVPSAFTPNNDGKNDIIRPFLPRAYNLLEFSIFNRWGQRIYSTSQTYEGWNGKLNDVLQDSGVYVWMIRAVETASGKRQERKGTFVLLR